jgi:ubiquitin carboxyl-terminal hydrolase 34
VTPRYSHELRSRRDMFNALSLEVRGMGSVVSALRHFGAGEVLDGVDCGACHGRHPHRKWLELETVPTLLALQLKRFDLDLTTWQRIKLNDAIDIGFSLSLAPFVDQPDVEFELMSIFMHVGLASSGHYYSFLKDASTGLWLKFNDAEVSAVDEAHLETLLRVAPRGSAEGAAESSALPSDTPKQTANASANAYMLIYRKISPSNCNTVEASVIPADLVSQTISDNRDFAVMKAAWEEVCCRHFSENQHLI